jgi:hypothetical protein
VPGLFLEFVALIALRIKLPNAVRPFKIKLNVFGLCLMTLIPFSVYAIALAGALSEEGGSFKPALFAIGALISAEVIWQIIVWQRPHIKAVPVVIEEL